MPVFTLKLEGRKAVTGTLTAGEDWLHYRVKIDQQTEKWDFAVRPAAVRVGSAPCVFNTGEIVHYESHRHSPFTEAWQWYAVELLSQSAYGMAYAELTTEQKARIVQAFNSVYQKNRAFCNTEGVDTGQNYVTGENMDMPIPRIEPLICGTNLVHGQKVQNENGVWMVRLHSFRPHEAPPAVVDLTDARVLSATVIYRNGVVRPFPQLGGIRVPYPLIGLEPTYFPLRELTEV